MNPRDAAERERIASALHATLFVEAGAGAGKTTELVARVLALLSDTADPVHLDQIVAITFTRKAATELRERIRKALVLEAHKPFARTALEQIDAAAIETIHAFAQRLLAQRPMDAGLPPGFSLLDEAEQTLESDRWWRDVYRKLLTDSDLADAWDRAFGMGVTEGRLRSLALAWSEEWDRLEALDPDAFRLPASAREAFLRQVDALLARCADCSDPNDKLVQHLMSWVPVRAAISDADLVLADALDSVGEHVTSPRTSGSAKVWSVPPSDIRGEIKAAMAEAARIRSGLRLEACGPILEALRAAVIAAALARAHAGRIRFQDLLIRARYLLREREDVCDALRAKYRRVLVDEFQDTDPIQVEIVERLAGEPGRLFVVGDPKQSIYRFRRADVTGFNRAREALGGSRVRLSANFRSRPGILDWVNETFAQRFDQPGQVEFAPMDAEVSGAAPRPCVRQLIVEDAPQVSVARRHEARSITEAIRTIIAEGWQVRAGDGERPARLSDIAILIPSRTMQAPLERALAEAGAPVRVDSSVYIWRTQELRGLVELLTAGLDPSDDVARVAALRHPCFGLADAEIVAHRRGQPSPRVAAALAKLQAVATEAQTATIPGWIACALETFGLLELATIDRRPRDAWARYRFFKECARRYAGSRGASPIGFIAWARTQMELDFRVEEAPAIDPDDDAVRVTTIHAAKGLEYPVVILAGLRKWRPQSRRPVCIFGVDGTCDVSVGNSERAIETLGYGPSKEHDAAQDALERERLIYVAATRARDYLILGPVAEQDLLAGLAVPPESLWTPEGAPPLPVAEPAAAAAPANLSAVAEATTWGWPAETATTLSNRDATEPDQDPHEEEPVSATGRQTLAVGRAVHAVLAQVDFADPSNVEALATAAALAEGVEGESDRVARDVRSALACGRVALARKPGARVWREVFVSGVVEGVLLEGYIDLLVQTDEGFWIIDYKTDAGDATKREAKMEGYAVQAAAYALALTATGRTPIAGATFVFVSGATPDERTVEDLSAQMEAVRQDLAARNG